jgi:hypothetical protein
MIEENGQWAAWGLFGLDLANEEGSRDEKSTIGLSWTSSIEWY